MHTLKMILESVRHDSPVKKVMHGLHWTAVVSRQCGLASSMISKSCHYHCSNLGATALRKALMDHSGRMAK